MVRHLSWWHGHNQTISMDKRRFMSTRLDAPAFGGTMKMREKARIAYEAENAKYKFSKLSNAVTRPPVSFKAGTLLMLWRKKVRPKKVSGQWVGPVRALVRKGNTVWADTQTTIIKARTTQLRACTKRGELQAALRTPQSIAHQSRWRLFSSPSQDATS